MNQSSIQSGERMRLRFEPVVYGAAFLLALALRLAAAGQTPLSDHEAELALQALALSRGQTALLGPHPLYLVLTTLWFSVFTATDWVARFWPAVVGSLLVLLPALFSDRIGKTPAVVMAVFLALDPGMVAISRQAGGPALAVFLTLLALGLWLRGGHPSLAGVAAGLALLGGPSIWAGCFGLLAVILLSKGVNYQPTSSRGLESAQSVEEGFRPMSPAWRPLALTMLLTLFLGGTLFFFVPNGLGTIGQSLTAYFGGWIPGSKTTNRISSGLMLLGLLLYEFLPLIFGLWRGITSIQRNDPEGGQSYRLDRFLLVWWLVALLLAVIYPSRQLPDLAWSLIPLWALAARQIVSLFSLPLHDRVPVIGQAILAAVIFTFISMAGVMMTIASDPQEYWFKIAGALALVAASIGLIAWGWSRQVAFRGALWGLTVVLTCYFLAAGWNAANLDGRGGVDLWSGASSARDGTLILSTLKNLDQWGPVKPGGPEVVVTGVVSPSLRWLLRNVEQVSYDTALSSTSNPAVVITPLQPQLSLASPYRGEAFVLSETIDWKQFKLGDWFRWQVFRTAPAATLVQDKIILWARSDLFPGGSVQTSPAGQ